MGRDQVSGEQGEPGPVEPARTEADEGQVEETPQATEEPAPKRLRDRSTADLVVLMLTFTAMFVVILDLVMLTVFAFFDTEQDLAEFARNVGDIVNVLIGAVVGYLAGRKV